MKILINIILVLFALSCIAFCFFSCKAQQTIIDVENRENWTTNTYLKDTNNRFSDVLGTWKWEEGNSSFELLFTKITNYSYDDINMSEDFILGKYKYIENDNIVANTMNNNTDTPLDFDLTLVFWSATKYEMIIEDVISNKVMKGFFILSNSNTTATFNLENTQGIKVNQSNVDFSLPTSLTLTKQ